MYNLGTGQKAKTYKGKKGKDIPVPGRGGP
jgi:hypothetical protein